MVLGSLLAMFWLMLSMRLAGKNYSISPRGLSISDRGYILNWNYSKINLIIYTLTLISLSSITTSAVALWHRNTSTSLQVRLPVHLVDDFFLHHAGQGLEHLVDWLPAFGAAFHVGHIVMFCLLFPFFPADLTFITYIDLVAYDHHLRFISDGVW